MLGFYFKYIAGIIVYCLIPVVIKQILHTVLCFLIELQILRNVVCVLWWHLQLYKMYREDLFTVQYCLGFSICLYILCMKTSYHAVLENAGGCNAVKRQTW